MKILKLNKNNLEKVISSVQNVRSKKSDVDQTVKDIINKVKEDGDKALYFYSKKFDKAELTSLQVSSEEIREAYSFVSKELVASLKQASKSISKFHKSILKKKEDCVETVPGVKVWREFRPIEKVGLYIPGGKAAYPSTVLMLAIPAQIAGCKEIAICTPCGMDGKCNPAVLVAADLCGISKIYKIGGAQAIAALAYGTESISKVYKIFGPGNQYVTTAKLLCFGEVNIDMPAGPSELLVVADSSTPPSYVAADLLSQLEHGTDSQSILVSLDADYMEEVIKEVKLQSKKLSRRQIIDESLLLSFAILADSMKTACNFINEYAPEHLQIATNCDQEILKEINNVGSVFLGKYSSEPLGDYATGSNHTLPTSGFAKMFPPLSTDSFGKMIQVQKISKKGIESLADDVINIAEIEQLDAHANAIKIRTNNN